MLTAGALLAAGDRAACARHLPGLADGSVVGASAWAETPGWEAADLTARAEPAGAGRLLGGTKRYVPAGPAEPGLVPAFARAADTGRLGLPDGAAVLARVRDLACTAPAAEQVGAASRALEVTVRYARDRVRFGRSIGSFQAVKHRLADMHTVVETARALARATSASPGSTRRTTSSSAPTAPPSCSVLRPRTGRGRRPTSVSPWRDDGPARCRTLAP
ncbi:acyl-CoA dehydrogenase family protein [Streptomyces nojiriensis]|uniref:acyl-CoA dehydrogenase family protein n=1 Tax=Streptomyces nojiriensis TaxID=66374 RepID=UPI0036DF2631